MILRAKHLAFAHGDTRVLRDVSLHIEKGRRIALLGENGSGKSTLFRLLAGAWQPLHGRLLLGGVPYSYSKKGRDQLRRTVQMVLQEPDDQIFAPTVAQDVSYGPVNMGLSDTQVRTRVEEALARCGITDLAEAIPHLLSFGQRKRVALAGALAMGPEVLLLDEPTAGLDPRGCRMVGEIITELAAGGTAIVFATHDVNFAYAHADQVAILHEGTLTQGPPDGVLVDNTLMERSGLELPWAPGVSRLLGRRVLRASDI